MTNAEVHRRLGRGASGALCEWEPEEARLARLTDRYHAVATVHIAAPSGGSLRVCPNCAQDAAAKIWARTRVGARGW